MDAIDALLTRKSAAMLVEPAPEKQELDQIFSAAVRAPDHGCLRPWQFILFKGDMRKELGSILADALKLKNPDASQAALDKEAERPFRAPLVMAVIAKVNKDAKIPAIEQVISAGAAAQNIMIAVHALGYAGIWRTGAPSFDGNVRARLGVTGDDHIVGFLYIGTAKTVPPMPDVDISDHVLEWKAALV